MKRLALIVALLCWSLGVSAGGIKEVLQNAGRTVNWANNVGVSGGIPNRTTICVTRSAGTSAATLNSDIAACSAAGGGVVKLNAGTFNLSAGITFSGSQNVTLRGAGAASTILHFTGSGVACVLPWQTAIALSNCNARYWAYDGTAHTNWTAGYTQGATVLTVASTASISAGQMVILDQIQDTSDTGGFISSACPSGDAKICESFQVSDEDAPGCNPANGCFSAHARGVCATTCSSSELGERTLTQVVRVVSKDSTHITITPGIYGQSWRSGQSPQVWWPDSGDIATVSYRNGVEDLTVDGYSSSVGASIMLYGTYESWVKNVRVIGNTSQQNSIIVHESARAEVRNCYIHGNSTSSTTNYGLVYIQASDSLFINNIIEGLSGAMTSSTGSGNVLAYNYSVKAATVSDVNWMQHSLQPHGPDWYILAEGNDINGWFADDLHGVGGFHTLVRNYIHGTEPGKTEDNGAINANAFRRGTNAVGNVLGENGYQDHYQDCASSAGTGCTTAVNTGNPDTAIYILGYGTTGTSQNLTPFDPKVVTTMVRWGNYDTVNDASRFLSAEVAPAGALAYMPAVTVPDTQTIPKTFFLNDQDRQKWWCFGATAGSCVSPAYPAAGPDVTCSVNCVPNAGSKAAKIPARLCYEAMADDPAFSAPNDVRLFDPGACYQAVTGGPSAPGNFHRVDLN